jgi:uncharacterized protein (UPF0333 family)
MREDKRAARQRGNVTLELALVLPFFLLLIAGAVDLGRLYWTKNVLTNASREGARAAALAAVTGAAQYTKTQVMLMAQDYITRYKLKDPQGSAITLAMDENFLYSWDTAASPPKLWVQLRNIPVKLMLLPSVEELFYGKFSPAIVALTTQTTMSPEWVTTPAP